MKKIPIFLLIATMLVPLLGSCGTTPNQNTENQTKFTWESLNKTMKISKLTYNYEVGDIQRMSRLALQDYYKNFWCGDAISGHGRGGWTAVNDIFLPALYEDYLLHPDAEIVAMFKNHSDILFDQLDKNEMTVAGTSWTTAGDDTFMTSNRYITTYRVSKDERLLEYASDLFYSGYERWWDGTYNGGLWYNNQGAKGGDGTFNRWKSLYNVAAVLTGFELWELTGDELALEYALKEYEWLDEYLYWDHGLYFCDYMDKGPGNGGAFYASREGSSSFLGGETAMAYCAYWLYKYYDNDGAYLQKVYNTLQGILDYLTLEDTFMMDRDACSNSAWFDYFVTMLIELHENSLDNGYFEKYREIFFNTAIMIHENNRTEDGFYDGAWCYLEEGEISNPTKAGSLPQVNFVSACSIHVITAAARLENYWLKTLAEENKVDEYTVHPLNYYDANPMQTEYDLLGGGNTTESNWTYSKNTWEATTVDGDLTFTGKQEWSSNITYKTQFNTNSGFYICFDLKWNPESCKKESLCISLNTADGSRVLNRAFCLAGQHTIESSYSTPSQWVSLVYPNSNWLSSDYVARMEMYCKAGSNEIVFNFRDINFNILLSTTLKKADVKNNSIFTSPFSFVFGGDSSMTCTICNIKCYTTYN